ncbi:MAG TPA: hypothetical protein VFM21_09770 [Terriglobia bacterium]|nr:hypothetical protein [Terriglobia bacterium]
MKSWTVVALVLAVTVASLAEEFWQSKPYTEWTKKDVDSMLSSSPWAQTVVLRKANLTPVRREFGKFATGAGEGEGTGNPEVDYSIYLRTSKPIRQAVVRAAALEQKYEQMDAASRTQFDKKWKQFLAQPFEDKIIVHVKYSSTTTDVDRQLATYWQAQTLDSVKSETFLNGPEGERLSPIAFWVGKGAAREFQFAFPRPREAPLRASFSIEFKHPDVTDQPASRIIARFNVKDLVYQGEVTF